MTPSLEIAVAVCARPSAPQLERCTAALTAAGAEFAVFTAAPGRGLADARNAALDVARGADVLALVEDDVAVGPGWLAALRAAWAAAEPDCGAIGGPVAIRLTGERPAWLTDAQLGLLGAWHGGSTFHGANVSFRVEALLGVGGFWPAVGHPSTRDWFSEEHHAQHALTAVGWRLEQAPSAAAERLVEPSSLTPRGLVARRVRYGARAAVAGDARDARGALKALAAGAAGAAVAAARRDPALALDRTARAAEGAGALAARRLAERDLRPAATQTPFRHSIPIVRRPSRITRARPLALMYHRVDRAPGAGVDPARFAAHMEALQATRTPVTMARLAERDAPRDAVAVTFDDGYAETLLTHVLPVLERTEVPATVFVVTGHVQSGRGFWWDEVPRLLRAGSGRPLRLSAAGETRAWATGGPGVLQHLVGWMQALAPEDIAVLTDQLRAWAGAAAQTPPAERPLTVEELRRLAATPLITIAAHTRTHPNLRLVPPARVDEELAGGRADLAGWLGSRAGAGLAYPFGVTGADVDDATCAAARHAGYAYAVVNNPGAIDRHTDRFAIPRVAAADVDGSAFAALLRRRDS